MTDRVVPLCFSDFGTCLGRRLGNFDLDSAGARDQTTGDGLRGARPVIRGGDGSVRGQSTRTETWIMEGDSRNQRQGTNKPAQTSRRDQTRDKGERGERMSERGTERKVERYVSSRVREKQ